MPTRAPRDIQVPKIVAALVGMLAVCRAGSHAHASGEAFGLKAAGWRSHEHGTRAEIDYC
jgi:hypothetical protein